MKKAQASVELLIILAVSLIAILAIYSVSNQSIVDARLQGEVLTAQSSLDSLAGAAKDVFVQGEGAKKQVYFFVPKGVDQAKSGIYSDSFVLNVFGSDLYSKSGVTLSGSIPTTEGGHYVTIEAKDDFQDFTCKALFSQTEAFLPSPCL
ncbi:MAG: hypothetical protein AABW99_02920 [archaeon]